MLRIHLIVVFLIFLLAVKLHALQEQLIPGAGPSTGITKLFAAEFAKSTPGKEYTFAVPERSTKHAGGIKASDIYIFGRTGRPLTAAESAKGKREILLGRTRIAFAIGEGAGVSGLSLDQLQSIYTGKVTNWKELGGANADIVLLGREPTESAFSELKRLYPFFGAAKFKLIAPRDHYVVTYLQSSAGRNAIGFGVASNFTELQTLEVKGLRAGLSVGLVYDEKNAQHPIVVAVQEFVKGKDWERALLASPYEMPL